MIQKISKTKLKVTFPGFLYDHYDSNLNIKIGSLLRINETGYFLFDYPPLS